MPSPQYVACPRGDRCLTGAQTHDLSGRQYLRCAQAAFLAGGAATSAATAAAAATAGVPSAGQVARARIEELRDEARSIIGSLPEATLADGDIVCPECGGTSFGAEEPTSTTWSVSHNRDGNPTIRADDQFFDGTHIYLTCAGCGSACQPPAGLADPDW